LNAMIDTDFKAPGVYRFGLATGWKAMKSDDAEWFLEKVLRITTRDPGFSVSSL